MSRLRKFAHRKTADRYGAHGDDDGNIQAHDPIGAMELRGSQVIVSPEDPEWRTVEQVARLSMSRDEKAEYMARGGFGPQAISAILAQVDRYTETSEG